MRAVRAATGAIDAGRRVGSRWHQAHVTSALKPDDRGRLVRDIAGVMRSQYDRSDQLPRLTLSVPTIMGDAESVRLEHAVALFRLRGGARHDAFAGGRPACQRRIVSNAHHSDSPDRADMLGSTILACLDRGLEDVGPAC